MADIVDDMLIGFWLAVSNELFYIGVDHEVANQIHKHVLYLNLDTCRYLDIIQELDFMDAGIIYGKVAMVSCI